MADRQLKIFNDHIWDGYKYIRSRQTGLTTYYACTNFRRRLCPARGILKNNVFRLRGVHTHPPNLKELRERSFKQDLCIGLNESLDNYRKVYDDRRSNHVEAAESVTFSRIENAMYKWRLRSFPLTVHSLGAFVNETRSVNGNRFLQCQNGTMNASLVVGEDGSESVIFLDQELIRQTFARGFFYIDATFKVAPKTIGAMQLLTIMSRKYNHAIACIWILMGRRTIEAYRAVFERIRRLVPGFEIVEVLTDYYESALRSALLLVFPGIILHGCWFHYKQALLRNALKLGLRRLLKNNEAAKHLLLLLMALPLLPAHLIRATYRQICLAQTPRLRRNFRSFFDYYEPQWLTTVTPEVFSVYMLLHRTNNSMEAYHKQLKVKLGINSCIWIFTKKLMSIHDGYIMDLRSLASGYDISRLPKTTTTKQQELLLNAWNTLNLPNGFLPMQFLEHALTIKFNTIEAYMALFGDT